MSNYRSNATTLSEYVHSGGGTPQPAFDLAKPARPLIHFFSYAQNSMDLTVKSKTRTMVVLLVVFVSWLECAGQIATLPNSLSECFTPITHMVRF